MEPYIACIFVINIAWDFECASIIAWVAAKEAASLPCSSKASDSFIPMGWPNPLNVAEAALEGSKPTTISPPSSVCVGVFVGGKWVSVYVFNDVCVYIHVCMCVCVY